VAAAAAAGRASSAASSSSSAEAGWPAGRGGLLRIRPRERSTSAIPPGPVPSVRPSGAVASQPSSPRRSNTHTHTHTHHGGQSSRPCYCASVQRIEPAGGGGGGGGRALGSPPPSLARLSALGLPWPLWRENGGRAAGRPAGRERDGPPPLPPQLTASRSLAPPLHGRSPSLARPLGRPSRLVPSRRPLHFTRA